MIRPIIYIILILTFSCKNKDNTHSLFSKKQIDSITQENLRKKDLKLRDSIIEINEKRYFKSISHIKNINGLYNNSIKILDSLPILKLPIGNEKSFFYNYPKTQESDYGKKSDYNKDNVKFYYKDSVATTMNQKAFITFKNQIKAINESVNILDLEVLLDSNLIGHKRGLPLKFIGVLQKENNFVSLLCQPSQYSYNSSYKIITLNFNGKIIDIFGLTASFDLPPNYKLYTNDLNYIDKNGVIYVKRSLVYPKSESTSDYIGFKSYKANNNGLILRYFITANAWFKKEYTSTSHGPNTPTHYLEAEEGQVVRNRKNGKWKEISMNYGKNKIKYFFDLKPPLFLNSNYKNGLKDGTWNYYNLQRDTLVDNRGAIEYKNTTKKGKYLLMQEIYRDNILQKREQYNTPWDSISKITQISPNIFLQQNVSYKKGDMLNVVAAPYLNLREALLEPRKHSLFDLSQGKKIVTQIPYGSSIRFIEETNKSFYNLEQNRVSQWIKIAYKNFEGYIPLNYVTKIKIPTSRKQMTLDNYLKNNATVGYVEEIPKTKKYVLKNTTLLKAVKYLSLFKPIIKNFELNTYPVTIQKKYKTVNVKIIKTDTVKNNLFQSFNNSLFYNLLQVNYQFNNRKKVTSLDIFQNKNDVIIKINKKI